MSGVVYTVGHGTRSTEELVAVLHSAHALRLIDVRRFPGSRRHPHFSEEALRRSLPDLGVSYEWWGDELGGRRSRRSLSRHTAWHSPSFQGYADHTDTPGFRQAVMRLQREASAGPSPVLMCAETLWWRCHRRLIADALVARGTEVVHLVDCPTRQRHPQHPCLRLGNDGWPVYDVGAPQVLFDL